MNSKRLYYLLCIAVGVLILGLLGGTAAANSLLQGEAKKLVAAKSQSQSLDEQQQQLSVAKRDIAKYQSLAAIAKDVVPQDKDQAEAVREIVNLASASGIKLGSITFPTSTLGGSAAAGGAAANPSAAAGAAPAASVKSPAYSQLVPVKGLNGVYSLEITIQSNTSASVPYARFLQFLTALEHNRHTALVSGITVQPDAKVAGNVNFTLIIDEYIKP